MADEAVFGGDDSLLLSLPDEMLAHVIGQALPRTIVALSLTCLRLRALCEEEEVWRALVSEMEGGNEWVQREANGEKVGEHAKDDVVQCAAYGRPCRGDRSEFWFDVCEVLSDCACAPLRPPRLSPDAVILYYYCFYFFPEKIFSWKVVYLSLRRSIPELPFLSEYYMVRPWQLGLVAWVVPFPFALTSKSSLVRWR